MERIIELVERNEIAEGTLALRFKVDGDFTFKAGQYCDFTPVNAIPLDAGGSTRTFSLASSPNETGFVMIVTRKGKTAFKQHLEHAPIGAKFKMSGPNGNFVLPKDETKPVIFLAGGIGITPVRSMVRWATEKQLPHKLHLFYSIHTPESTPFFEELEKYAEENPNFTFTPTLTGNEHHDWKYERGRISEEMLKKHSGNLVEAIPYAVGSAGFISAVLSILGRAGANEDAIKTEEFPGY